MTEAEVGGRPAATGIIRLGIGLAQGVAAWLLVDGAKQAWSGSQPGLFAGLVIVTAFAPPILLAGLSHMRRTTLVVWALAASALVFTLGLYDIWRDPWDGLGSLGMVRRWPSAELIGFGGVGLYIAHHLIEPADVERRWWPSYPARFESAWRHGFQLALAVLFTGVFWGVLQLGAALFDVIGVKVIGETIRKTWFIWPATTLAFASAVHLTDVRPGLIRGLRTVALTLLAWLTPLAAGLAGAFLLTLPFTGLAKLWATHTSTALLLSAAALLVVLMNAAYQDGRDRSALPTLLRWSVRIAAILLMPLTLLAAWATFLRVGQYGLTPERIVSIALLIATFAYAAGYGWASLSRGAWMRRLEAVNVVAALLVLALILSLLSPFADPARLATADQASRLNAHRTPAERFDFSFLRFRAARFGREALDKLAASRDAKIAQAAKAARALTSPVIVTFPAEVSNAREPAFSHARVWPVGAALPTGFRDQMWKNEYPFGPLCLTGGAPCDLVVLKTGGAADKPMVLVLSDPAQTMISAYGPDPGGGWVRLGRYFGGECAGVADALRAGSVQTAPPTAPDLEAAGNHLAFQAELPCPAKVAPRPPRQTPNVAKAPANR